MMNRSSGYVSIRNAVPLCYLVQAVLIVLKLTRVITWSWWWVLTPWWISLGVGLIIAAIALAVIIITASRGGR